MRFEPIRVTIEKIAHIVILAAERVARRDRQMPDMGISRSQLQRFIVCLRGLFMLAQTGGGVTFHAVGAGVRDAIDTGLLGQMFRLDEVATADTQQNRRVARRRGTWHDRDAFEQHAHRRVKVAVGDERLCQCFPICDIFGRAGHRFVQAGHGVRGAADVEQRHTQKRLGLGIVPAENHRLGGIPRRSLQVAKLPAQFGAAFAQTGMIRIGIQSPIQFRLGGIEPAVTQSCLLYTSRCV